MSNSLAVGGGICCGVCIRGNTSHEAPHCFLVGVLMGGGGDLLVVALMLMPPHD